MREKLQFTLFAKILALTASVVFTVFFYFYQMLSELLEPLIIQSDIKQSLFWLTYFTAGVIATGLIASAYLIALSVTSPIKKLVSLTSRVSKGEFEISQDSFSPLPSDEIGLLSRHFLSMADELKKREKSRSLLQKLHGREITDKFLQGALDNQATLKNITVMFIDIREFTKFAEDQSPTLVLEKLNAFFEQCGEVVMKNNGVIDKFMGDSLMAVWGVLDEDDQQQAHSRNAINCAFEINALNLDFDMGIGVHCGPAILGGVGTQRQRDYTVIGDTVNTAARLQQASRLYNTNLVISKDVMTTANLTNEIVNFDLKARKFELAGKCKVVEVFICERALKQAA